MLKIKTADFELEYDSQISSTSPTQPSTSSLAYDKITVTSVDAAPWSDNGDKLFRFYKNDKLLALYNQMTDLKCGWVTYANSPDSVTNNIATFIATEALMEPQRPYVEGNALRVDKIWLNSRT